MLIKNVSILLGPELDFVSNIDVKIQNKIFKKFNHGLNQVLKKKF